MSEHDWIDVLLRGSLEITLPTLSAVQANSPRFHGSGRLVWDRDSGLRFLGVTDGAETVSSTFGRFAAPLGRLIPRDTYVSITGRTLEGWDASTIPVPLGGYTVSMESPHVLWDLTGDGLTLARPLTPHKQHPRLVRALLGPPAKHWPRVTHTEIRNEYSRSSSSKADWLEAKIQLGTLVAQQRSDHWFEIRLTVESDSAPGDSFEIVHAVAQAFGFVLGRRVWIQGLEDLQTDRETRHLYRYREPTRNSLRPPLGEATAYLNNVETLLGKAVDFFLTKEGQKVAQYLDLCWDTVDNDFRTSVALVSICAESLLRLASKGLPEKDPGYTPMDRDTLCSWVESKEGSLTKRFLDRVRGFINTLSQRRPIDVLWAWHREGVLGVTPEDIDAWEKSRHPSAHGAFGPLPDVVQLQRRLDRFHRVQNLMNRIVLHLVGYRGPYMDYARWSEAEFPPEKVDTGTAVTS